MRYRRSLLLASIEQIKRTLPLLLLLRRPDSTFSFVTQTNCDSDKFRENVVSESHSRTDQELRNNMGNDNGDVGLLLYYNKFSFYSQKVVMALYEKNLTFATRDIDLNGEQYKPWFLQINPKGEVPVLQDTGKIIPDSGTIIDYLEDNFSNGNTPRLVPTDQGAEVRQKVTHFRNLIDKINGNVLTIGSLLHPELATGPKKVPFIAPVRKQLLEADQNSAANLRKYAAQTPAAKDMLLQKAENQEKKREKLLVKDEFLAICNQTEEVFDKVEEELAQHVKDKENWWLCTDQFTVADLSLTILMTRINQIGMEPYFWANGKRPHVERYFKRVQERDSYKNTIPTTFALVKTILSQVPVLIGVSIFAAVILIVGGYFVIKKAIR